MTMTFSFSMTCGSCKATLTYHEERPAWKTYDYRVEEADECERSARFVAEHADEEPPAFFPHFYRESEPTFVDVMCRRDTEGVVTRRYELHIPDPYRYVDCPVCDAQVKEPGR